MAGGGSKRRKKGWGKKRTETPSPRRVMRVAFTVLSARLVALVELKLHPNEIRHWHFGKGFQRRREKDDGCSETSSGCLHGVLLWTSNFPLML